MKDLNSIFDSVKNRFKVSGMNLVLLDVMNNYLTGKALKVKWGNLRRNVAAATRLTQNGFVIRTTQDYGIAWEIGSKETPGFIKQVTIVPKAGRVSKSINPRTNKPYRAALKIPVKRGKKSGFIFRYSVTIPPRRVRPFIAPAVETNEPKLIKLLTEVLNEEFKNLPDYKFTIKVQ